MLDPIQGQFSPTQRNLFLCPGTPKGIHYKTGFLAWAAHLLNKNARLEVMVNHRRQRIYVPLDSIPTRGAVGAKQIERMMTGILLSKVQQRAELIKQYNDLASQYRAPISTALNIPTIPEGFEDKEVLKAYQEAEEARRTYLASKSLQAQPAPSSQPPKLTPHQQVVYSLANNNALLLCDWTRGAAQGTLTLRIDENHYIKLRNLTLYAEGMEPKPDLRGWIPLGQPPVLYIHPNDFQREIDQHNNESLFGPFENIRTAVEKFIDASNSPIEEIDFKDAPSEYKLTTEMGASGAFRVVKKRAGQRGSSKQISEVTTQEKRHPPKQARAKLVQKGQKEDPAFVIPLQEEAAFSQMLVQRGVRHVIPMEVAPSQKRTKTRVDMPFIEGGDLIDVLSSSSPPNQQELLSYMTDIAETLSDLHRTGYTHNDLKLDNYMVDRSANEARLIDFGSATPIGVRFSPRNRRVTFVTPEWVNDNPNLQATSQGDCWLFGLSLYLALTQDQRTVDLASAGTCKSMEAIATIQAKLREPRNPVQQLIIELISPDPRNRPSMEEAATRLRGIVGRS